MTCINASFRALQSRIRNAVLSQRLNLSDSEVKRNRLFGLIRFYICHEGTTCIAHAFHIVGGIFSILVL